MKLSIDAAHADDVPVLCELAREIWRAHYPAIIGTAQTEYMLAQRYDPALVAAELERIDIWWDVLRSERRIVAFSSSLRTDAADALKLDKLYVHADWQRRGCGAMLIAHVRDRARSLGMRRVVLSVNKHNHTAIAAYTKHGFEIVDAVVKDIGAGFVMDDYVMALEA